MKCKNCKWWEQDEEEKNCYGYFTGWCHRFPPLLKPLPKMEGGHGWPTTEDYDWCGEFVDKDKNRIGKLPCD